MNNLDLSIIIASYNTSKLLLNCIRSIVETVKKINYEILVVDNASTDDTVIRLRQGFGGQGKIKNLKIIENKENFGFSKANNIGVKNSKGMYVLFLNPDTLIYENTLDAMVEFMDIQKDAGASTCFLELTNGKLDDAAHRGFPTPWRSFSHFSYLSKVFPKVKFLSGYNMTYLDMNKVHEIDACAGAFMLVRRKAGEELNWWDEDYFWYGEDLDFCFRLKLKGWKIYFVPKYKTLHYKGASGGIKKISKHLSSADKQTQDKAINSRFMAMKIFYDKHYKKAYPFLISNLVLLGINSRWFITKIQNELMHAQKRLTPLLGRREK